MIDYYIQPRKLAPSNFLFQVFCEKWRIEMQIIPAIQLVLVIELAWIKRGKDF
jgi:hypothetical protein